MKTITSLFIMTAVLGTMSCKENGEGPGPGGDNPPGNTPRTEVPNELVGAWQSSPIDFSLWENYDNNEGYYADRDAVPSREAMVFSRNGDAKFYRYEFAFGFYEELIDCEGTVAFNTSDGTFTFYPVKGRKRHYDSRYSANNVNRALTSTELNDPKLAGKRRYSYLATSQPPAIEIIVPGSEPYNWYKKP